MPGTAIAMWMANHHIPGGTNVTRRRIRETLMSAGALLILIGALAMIDDRVRDQLAPAGVWDRVTSQRRQVVMAGGTVYDVIADHDKLAVFVVAASVLVVCMLRT
jgi:hypothetical protein